MLLMSWGKKLFGNVLTTLLLYSSMLAVIVLLMSAAAASTPATSIAPGYEKTNAIPSSPKSVSFKKPQGFAANASISLATSQHGAGLRAPAARADSLPASRTSSTSSIFIWGHVTKYSSILYDEDIVVKGPIALDVKYPNDVSININSFITNVAERL